MNIGRTALVILLVLACGGTREAPAPRELALGVDVCEYCHMTLDDPDRAAQWVEPDGRALTFDEPGCLVAWLAARPAARGEAFVADAEGTGWVPAAEAVFVRGGARTAMGFDLLAYRDRAAAERIAAAVGGDVQDWSALRAEGVADAHAH